MCLTLPVSGGQEWLADGCKQVAARAAGWLSENAPTTTQTKKGCDILRHFDNFCIMFYFPQKLTTYLL